MWMFAIFAMVVVLLAVPLVAVAMWFDVGHRGGGVLDERRRAARTWRPPFARGSDLMAWAAATTERLVTRRLSEKPTAQSPVQLAAEVQAGAMRAMLPLAEPCDRECVVPCPEVGQGRIGVTVPEALEIADYIRQHLPRAEAKRIHDLAARNSLTLANVARQDDAPPNMRCPLQGEDRVCVVYPDRPLRCRPLHAMAIAEQLGIELCNDGEAPWKHHEETVERGVEQGFINALKSAGLDDERYELNSALLTALDAPDAAERWVRGENVFGKCKLDREIKPSRVLAE